MCKKSSTFALAKVLNTKNDRLNGAGFLVVCIYITHPFLRSGNVPFTSGWRCKSRHKKSTPEKECQYSANSAKTLRILC